MDASIISLRGLLGSAKAGAVDIDALAREHGAFLRSRNFDTPVEMLRALLLYVVSDVSYKDAAAALTASDAAISRSALHKALTRSGDWLCSIINGLLAADSRAPKNGASVLRAIDASSISGPGTHGTDWRLHAVCDPLTGEMVSMTLTDATAGESVAHHPVRPDWVALFDRGYPTANNLLRLVESGAGFIVRHVPKNLRLHDEAGERIDFGKLNRRTRVGEPTSLTVWMPVRVKHGKAGRPSPPVPPRRVALRLVIVRLRDGELLWYLSNLPESVTAEQISAVYRLRWQVELMFKRLKSLGGLDRLKTRRGAGARAWLLANLLISILAQKIVGRRGESGVPHHDDSAWSLFRAALLALRECLTRNSFTSLCTDPAHLVRLRNSPRKRRKQRVMPALRTVLKLGF